MRGSMGARRLGDRPRSGRALVEVMEPADLRDRHETSAARRWEFGGTWAVLVECLMGAHGVVVAHVAPQESTQMPFIEDDHVVEAIATDGADEPFHEGILPGCARGGEDLADSHTLDSPHELLAV